MKTNQDRKPAVAGSFYPYNENKLKNDVITLLKNAKAKKNNTKAVISPHAGYVFSGQVAANAISQIDSNKEYENIFVVGISHHLVNTQGASVYNLGDYIIPGAKINVNIDLASKLINESEYFFCDKQLHELEHSVEVQLPILFYHLKNKFRIVPILITTQDSLILKNIAEVLKPYFNNEKNVFVFSSDFSHYPSYEDAVINDNNTAQALLLNNPEKFIKVLQENKNKNIPGLATSACGAGDLIVLLNLTYQNNNYKYEIIDYKNSGDSPYGDKVNVVGYYAISVRKMIQFELSENEKKELLKISRNTLNSYIKTGKTVKPDTSLFSDNLKKNIGAFVTLTKKGKLRGCIGRFMPNQKLWSVVQEMTVAASSEDSRFSPVRADELDDIDIEISVLTPLQKINSADEVQIGRDGIYIKKGIRSGTLLPQVATENNWDSLQFLEYCSEYKAGIGKDGWKKADLFVYQAIIFHE